MGQIWLFEGEQQKKDLSQWFTPPKLAQRVVDWILKHHPNVRTILEPSAGRGALIRPLLVIDPTLNVIAYEIDPDSLQSLRGFEREFQVICADFLEAEKRPVDLVLMNPPFENDLDAKFVLKALEVAPVVVSILRGVIKHGKRRWDLLWRWVDIVREVNLVLRPDFGGDNSPKQDFVVLELVKREIPRKKSEVQSMSHTIEWW